MDQQNLRSLYEQLAAAGFGDELNEKLSDTVRTGRKLFGLCFGKMYPLDGSVPGDPQTHDVMVFELYFRQSGLPGAYSFEGFNARLYPANSPGAFSCWYDPFKCTIEQVYHEMKNDLGHLLQPLPVVTTSGTKRKNDSGNAIARKRKAGTSVKGLRK